MNQKLLKESIRKAIKSVIKEGYEDNEPDFDYDIDYGELRQNSRDRRQAEEFESFDKENRFQEDLYKNISHLRHQTEQMLKFHEKLMLIDKRHKPTNYSFYLELSDELQKLEQLIESRLRQCLLFILFLFATV